MDSTITLEQAKLLVKSKSHLYKAMIRNGWYLPKLKSSVVTEKYLNGVRDKKYYCPKYSDLKTLPCPDPPGKEFLLDEVMKFTNAKRLDIGAVEGKVPDSDWLLQVLAILSPDHDVFRKDYMPPIKEVKKEDLVVDNSDNFFSGLPLLKKKKDFKTISKLKQYRFGSIESRVKKLKEQKALLEKRIVMLGEKMKEEEK